MTLKEKYDLIAKKNANVHIFFDMDGVVARWENVTWEDTSAPGYFVHRQVEWNALKAVLLLRAAGFDVSFLSSVYRKSAEAEKALWLESHQAGDVKKIFVEGAANKADSIAIEDNHLYVLIDDYTPNLIRWLDHHVNAKMLALKFLNGINGNTSEWDGYVISSKSSADIIAHSIINLVLAET